MLKVIFQKVGNIILIILPYLSYLKFNKFKHWKETNDLYFSTYII